MTTHDGRLPNIESVTAAGDALSEARRLLCDPTPNNLALCCGAMAVAQKAIHGIRSGFTENYPGDRALQAVTRRLRTDIDAIGALLSSAARYHAGLLDRMSAAAAQAPGPLAAPVHGAHIEVKA